MVEDAGKNNSKKKFKFKPLAVIPVIASIISILTGVFALSGSFKACFQRPDLRFSNFDQPGAIEALPGMEPLTMRVGSDEYPVFPEGATLRISASHNGQGTLSATLRSMEMKVDFQPGERPDLTYKIGEQDIKGPVDETFIVKLDGKTAEVWWRDREKNKCRIQGGDFFRVPCNQRVVKVLPGQSAIIHIDLQAVKTGLYMVFFRFQYDMAGELMPAHDTQVLRIYYEEG